ncbi:MAG: OmpA family protein [Magnetococcales bacterium]|nr:OmpA family protein [Magnetococcales bacterium]
MVTPSRKVLLGAWLLSALLTAACHPAPPNPSQAGDDWRRSDVDQDKTPLVRDHCPPTPPGAAVDNRGCAIDSDRDGVLENDDRCPGTPYGVPVDAVGCPRDSDGDGVIDDQDQCPNTPHGVAVDKVGCPLDSDGDGVLDHLDACPGTPIGAVVDARGCWVIPNLNFATGSWTIPAHTHESLRNVVDILKRNADLRVTIQGHTDNVGGEMFNQDLSLKRAKAVLNHLVAQGVVTGRMQAAGFGLTQPVATNDTPVGRAQNRRVVLDIPTRKSP